MNTLFVTPNASGTGEAITAMRLGERLARSGHDVRYFTDPFNAGLLSERYGSGVDEIPEDPREIEARWRLLLRTFKPRVIVFADYPLLALSERGRCLLSLLGPGSADGVDADLITFDHLGMAQGPLTLPFSPPHLDVFLFQIPALPSRMKILFPCPMQSPTRTDTDRGIPFRQYDFPVAIDESRRREIRQRFGLRENELLIFHSAPSWAIRFCRHHGLPNYSYLTRVFEGFFEHVPRRIVVVSVNGGALMKPSATSALRLINLSRISPSEYDAILLAGDLMIADNRISSSLGTAVCGLIPCAALRNSHRVLDLIDHADGAARSLAMEMERERIGSVFPFEVFPIWSRDDVEKLGLFSGNPIEKCVQMIEIFGGDETCTALEGLLVDEAARVGMQARQSEYVSLVRKLPAGDEALLSLVQ